MQGGRNVETIIEKLKHLVHYESCKKKTLLKKTFFRKLALK